ncbi:hypothetical protein JZ751_021879, partial [Albula glossodonta]
MYTGRRGKPLTLMRSARPNPVLQSDYRLVVACVEHLADAFEVSRGLLAQSVPLHRRRHEKEIRCQLNTKTQSAAAQVSHVRLQTAI